MSVPNLEVRTSWREGELRLYVQYNTPYLSHPSRGDVWDPVHLPSKFANTFSWTVNAYKEE